VLLYLHLAAVAFALLTLSQTKHETWFLTATAGVLVFFTSAMVAHRTLFEARPAARYLTEFYLWMSFGGALGGLSAALIAPKIFSEVFEYPLLLALSMACRPGVFDIAALRRVAGSIAALLGRIAPVPERWRTGEMTENDKQNALVLWLIAAGGILTIYWLPWAINRLGISVGEWGTTPVVVALRSLSTDYFPGCLVRDAGFELRRTDPGGRSLMADDHAWRLARHDRPGAGIDDSASHAVLARRGGYFG